MTDIIRADTAGFCMGVDLALRELDKVVAEQGGPVFTLGPIIHNPQVLEAYAEKGVRIAKGPLEIAGQVRWLYALDPDGNVLEFIQWL